MYVALLRGVNVGGKNLVPMKELTKLFASEGCSDVHTYIQSGNVIFNAQSDLVDGLAERMSQLIMTRFKCRIPVVLRTSSQLSEVVRGNPFLDAGAPEEMLHVYFLATKPRPESVQGLDRQRSLPDLFQVLGQEIYLQLPRGVAFTKLTNSYFDLMLRTVSTSRNWRTVLRLAELAGA